MRESFAQADKRNRRICREVIEVVKTIPDSEAVLIVVYKAITDDLGTTHFENILRADLQAAGIDIDKTVEVVDSGQKVMKRRINFTTWGKHTATNDYSYCTCEIQVGILHRGLLDLQGNYLGQRGSLHLSDYDRKMLTDLQLSEVAHCAYQAINRIACRNVDGNKAKPAKVWLIHYGKGLEKVLEPVLQGATWETWKPKFKEPKPRKATGKTNGLVSRIAGYMAIMADQGMVETSALKEAVQTDNDKMFRRAVQAFLKDNPAWVRQGHRLVFMAKAA